MSGHGVFPKTRLMRVDRKGGIGGVPLFFCLLLAWRESAKREQAPL
jgi:hypothetical protein